MTTPPTTASRADALEPALRAVDELVDGFLEDPAVPRFRGRIPGIAYGIVVDGELVHARGVGSRLIASDGVSGAGGAPDADTVFRIASMTKSFTAAAILALRDDGRLDLDDPVARHVPALAGLRLPTADSPWVSIRKLLTMTAGFPTDDPWGDRQQGLPFDRFAELLRNGLTFAWAPGTTFEYSNLGYGILGRVIADVAGVEYREFVRERFLRPLGMDATAYLEEEVPDDRLARGYHWRDGRYEPEPIDGYGALSSMGGVFTSVRDLARWVAFFADAFPPRDDPEERGALSRASRREMQVVHQAFAPEIGGGWAGRPTVVETGYGYGLAVDEDLRHGRIVAHSGGYPGYGANMAWHLATGIGVIALANARYAPSRLLANRMLESLLEARIVAPRRLELASATNEAREAIERLLGGWDEDLATRWFAMNLDLDEPIARRRAEFERLAALHGALVRDDTPSEDTSPYESTWWLRGDRGRVRASILLTPEVPPRIQAIDLRSVPDAPSDLASAARSIVASLARWDAEWPAEVHVLDTEGGRDDAASNGAMAGATSSESGAAPEQIRRAFRAVAARFAPVHPGPLVDGDGDHTATWTLAADGATIELAITRTGPPGSALSSVSLTPSAFKPPAST